MLSLLDQAGTTSFLVAKLEDLTYSDWKHQMTEKLRGTYLSPAKNSVYILLNVKLVLQPTEILIHLNFTPVPVLMAKSIFAVVSVFQAKKTETV